MPTEASARHALPFLSAGQAQKELTHNEALALIDAGLHPAAEQFGLNTPPAAPAPGQCWIAGPAPGGAWADHAHALACWTPSGWRFLAAREGMRVWLRDQQCWAVRQSSGWAVAARQPAITPPTGGATMDAEARAAIDTIIARLIAHGIIAA